MLVLYCDGLCEPNPGGTAAYGWVAYRNGAKMAESCAVVCEGPEATNNLAEYAAVAAALEWALLTGEKEVEVRSDSELLVRQLQGRYRVRAPHLTFWHERVRRLAARFDGVHFVWVPRERNAEADALSRKALQNHAGGAFEDVRRSRAESLIAGVVPLGGTRYRVPSQGTPGVWYLVDVAAPDCTCPDFRKRCRRVGAKCKHVLAAEMATAGA